MNLKEGTEVHRGAGSREGASGIVCTKVGGQGCEDLGECELGGVQCQGEHEHGLQDIKRCRERHGFSLGRR